MSEGFTKHTVTDEEAVQSVLQSVANYQKARMQPVEKMVQKKEGGGFFRFFKPKHSEVTSSPPHPSIKNKSSP